MTTTASRNILFGKITGMGGPNPTPTIAMAGRTILYAENDGETVNFVGASADLGGQVLAVNNETAPNYHVLTSNGLVIVDNSEPPEIVSSHSFDPGDGRWLFMSQGTNLVTPLSRGGIQVRNPVTGAQISQSFGNLTSSRFGAGNPSYGHVWAVDDIKGRIACYKVGPTGSLTFVGTCRAPNCKDVIKVVADYTFGHLFIVCRRRIVRFTVPTTDVEDNEIIPVFAQDYGVSPVNYTDFCVMDFDSGDNRYWIGREGFDESYPFPYYFGPTFGIWNRDMGENGKLIAAAPRSNMWAVTDVVPSHEFEYIPSTPIPAPGPVVPPVVPPIIIAPAAPVITSSLTASVIEDTAFSYTITATGTGPIYYDVVSPPSWLTGINHITGVITGPPPDPATVNITVTATNAGGTDTETLVVTVVNAVGNFAQVTVNGAITGSVISGGVLYITGSFTGVADASGSLSRTGAAAINIGTGLWTSWAPVLVAGSNVLRCRFHGGMIYIYGSVTSVNGSGVNRACRVHPTTGVLDSGWLPNFNNTVHDIALNGTTMLAQGAFTTVNGGARTGFTDVDLVSAVAGSLTIRNAAGTDSSTTVAESAVRFSGSSFFASCSSINTGAGQNQSDGYGFFSLSSGNAGQMSRAASGSAPRAIETSGGNYLVAFPSSTQTWYILPAYSTISFTTQGFACVNSLGAQTAALPASPGAEGYDVRFLPDGSFMFAGQTNSGITGYPGCRGIFRTTSGGSLDTGFAPTWGVGTVRVNRLEPYLTAVFALGDWTATVNGETRDNFAVFNPDTGSLL